MTEFDLLEFAQMFDAALASDNPSVKKALRNFMMVAAIVHAQESNDGIGKLAGPLETLINRVNDLEKLVQNLNKNTKYYDDYYKKTYTNYPTWVYSPNTSTSTSTASSTVSPTDITSILKDLKFS